VNDDPKFDDLIARNRLLVAEAAHVRRDASWLRATARVELVRVSVAQSLAAIRQAWSASQRSRCLRSDRQ
jgi:dihydroorotase-like cyclic amidohydrolase